MDIEVFDENGKALHIGDVISRLFKVNRYVCDIEVDDVGDSGYLIVRKTKNGNFVKWDDIQNILNDL